MLRQSTIERVLNAAFETGGDFAEVFIEDKRSNLLNMLGGVLESAVSARDFGVGIRILKGYFSVYAYTNDSSEENLIKVARSAAQAINGKKLDVVIDLCKKDIENLHQIKIMPDSISKKQKVDWMYRAHKGAKGYDPIIEQTSIGFSNYIQNILIANTEGTFVEDVRSRNNLTISAIAVKGTEKEIGFMSTSYFGGLEHMESLNVEEVAREAARSAKTILNADYAPTGTFPVVISNNGGALFHEACGHGLESSSVAYNTSVFAGKLGQYVASPIVSAYDDGTIPNAWGSLNIDDEGMATQKNLLIENGILKGYLIDKLGSRRMGMAPTGSGRRESYQYAPTSRMNNTFIATGESTPEEIISETEYGIFAKYINGGTVSTSTGDYNFSISEGYIIREGKIAEPIKGATLIGNGLETLKKVDMVGNDLNLFPGMCGASSGSIPVTVGQPTIRVSELIVGGRKED